MAEQKQMFERLKLSLWFLKNQCNSQHWFHLSRERFVTSKKMGSKDLLFSFSSLLFVLFFAIVFHLPFFLINIGRLISFNLCISVSFLEDKIRFLSVFSWDYLKAWQMRFDCGRHTDKNLGMFHQYSGVHIVWCSNIGKI